MSRLNSPASQELRCPTRSAFGTPSVPRCPSAAPTHRGSEKAVQRPRSADLAYPADCEIGVHVEDRFVRPPRRAGRRRTACRSRTRGGSSPSRCPSRRLRSRIVHRGDLLLDAARVRIARRVGPRTASQLEVVVRAVVRHGQPVGPRPKRSDWLSVLGQDDREARRSQAGRTGGSSSCRSPPKCRTRILRQGCAPEPMPLQPRMRRWRRWSRALRAEPLCEPSAWSFSLS